MKAKPGRDVTQTRQSQGEVREHRSVGIVSHSPANGAMRRVRQAMTPLQEGASGNEFPEEAAGLAVHAATLQLRRDIDQAQSRLNEALSHSAPNPAATQRQPRGFGVRL